MCHERVCAQSDHTHQHTLGVFAALRTGRGDVWRGGACGACGRVGGGGGQSGCEDGPLGGDVWHVEEQRCHRRYLEGEGLMGGGGVKKGGGGGS